MDVPDSVITITGKNPGKNPGKTLAVFCGVHGNERVGIEAVEQLVREIEILNGTVYFVYANPRAIEQNVRSTEKNLNRAFVAGNAGTAYEDARARELMGLLDTVDALLDVHASNTPEATPFVIYGAPAEPFVPYLDFDIVSTGWDDVEPGATEGYLLRQGKPGICIECGYINDGGKYGTLAQDSIRAFLTFYGAIAGDLGPARKQRRFHAYKALIKEDESFEYYKQYADFESLPAGTCFARDAQKEYCVDEDSAIVFATNKKVGDEACVLGRWL